MRRCLQALCLSLAVLLLLPSCLNSDDDNVTLYDDVAITAFSLGTLNRYLPNSNDSIVKTTLSGSSYRFSIDQLGCRIFNNKRLPYGTDVAHVLCTVTAKNGGVVFVKSLTSDSVVYYSSTDSIDFSQPRTLRVLSTDGSAYRDYTVTLNVRQTLADTFDWEEEPDANAGLSHFQPHEALDDGMTWLGASAYGLEDYSFTAKGQLVMRSERTDWKWQPETFEATADTVLLPRTNLACTSWAYPVAGKAACTLVVGDSEANDTHQVVWRKIADFDRTGLTGQWTYMPMTEDKNYYLPKGVQLSLVYFRGSVLAFGDNQLVYESRDGGVTWKTSTSYAQPDGATGQVSVVADGDSLWFSCPATGQYWHGLWNEE